MRKIKEILRLHFEQKLGQRQIARSIRTSQSTVREYLTRAKAAGLGWPLGEEWDEDRGNEHCSRPTRRRGNRRSRRRPITFIYASNWNSTAT